MAWSAWHGYGPPDDLHGSGRQFIVVGIGATGVSAECVALAVPQEIAFVDCIPVYIGSNQRVG